MRKLKLAILGQGRSGRDIHGKYLQTVPEKYEIAYVVDPIEQRRARAEREYGCKTFADYTALLDIKDIDLVVNATPSHLHTAITTDLLDHGFNVLCDKPFAQTVQQIDQMVAASEKSGKTLAVFQQSRFAPYFEQVQKVIASGVLGRLVQISICFNGYARRWDWQCCQEFGAGSLYNTGPHPMDQAMALLGFPEAMPSVTCKMDRVNTFGDAEDYVKLMMMSPDKPLIDVEISSCDGSSPHTYRLMGSKGSMWGGMTRMDWKYFKPEEAPPQKLIKEPLHDEEWLPLYCKEDLKWYEDSWEVADAGTFSYATGKLYDTVYDNIVNGTPLVVTPQQVRKQIAVIQECHRQNPLEAFK